MRDDLVLICRCSWTGSVPLQKGPNGFETKLKLPWGSKTAYKYIVDGNWVTDVSKPSESDGKNNINNIYFSPVSGGSMPLGYKANYC
jgi:hypothetical protein